MPQSLFLQNCRLIRIEIRAHVLIFFKRTPPDGWLWIWSIFKQFFYTHSRKHLELFERFTFEIIRLFLLFMPGFRKPWSQGMLTSLVTGRNNDYIYKTFHTSVNIEKLKNLFAKDNSPTAKKFVKNVSFPCFAKNKLESFKWSICEKNENTQCSHVTKRSA